MEKKTFKIIINESSSTSSISKKKKKTIKNIKVNKLSSLIEKQYCKNINNEIDDTKLEIFEVCLVKNKDIIKNVESQDSIILSDDNKFKIIKNNESIDSVILSE
jgi:hypothetical protein